MVLATDIVVIQRLDIHARSAHIGTDETDARIVGIVVKLGVLPCDRALRGEIGRRVVIIHGTNGHYATQPAWIRRLVGVEIRRRTTGRHTHVVRDGAVKLDVALIASAHQTDDARVQNGFTRTAQCVP